ncbi:hypothetical protein BIV57_05830 [Mangrovactinospora gilvigrisea]|uniref:VCBS repeat-containing protein n=1 Tax=Mangrovactinospora gilvigrisea TaxID=1428644 RepID=A0A1J7BY89_9ACTN|nr:hypothetical protein BIV57_05830 [Mangrovactinospora gilvigrisea]
MATAAALAAVTAAVLVGRPGETQAHSAEPVRGAGAVPVSSVPLDCGGVGVAVTKRITADLDHDGRPDTALAAHCNAGTGSPPDGIFLYTPARGTAKPIVLLDPRKGLTVKKLVLQDGRLRATMLGYSSPEVPRCCADLSGDVHWEWTSGIFKLEGTEPAGGLTQSV